MDMFNILKNFDAASSGKKVGTAGAAKNEMKAILESFQAVQECGMDPMTSTPPADPVTMNVTLNARGNDAIEDLIALIGGKKEEPKGMEMPIAIGPKPGADKHDDMRHLMNLAAQEHGDEEEMESWDNSPEEEYSDHNTMIHDLSGGINREKNMYKRAQPGDNAMAVDEDTLDELADIKAQLSAMWKQKVSTLDEADPAPVANPYKGADAAKFAAMSPEDQAWLTKGGGVPDINDDIILSRAPNGGKPVQKPAAAPAAPAAAPQATDQRVNPDSQQGQMLAQQTAGMDDPASGVAGVQGGSQQDNMLAAQTAGMDEPAAAAPAAAPAAGKPAAPAAGGKPAAAPAGGAGKATKADADAMTKAIKDFQTKAGLKADGIVGKDTMAALKAAQSGAPAAGGKPAAAPAAGGAGAGRGGQGGPTAAQATQAAQQQATNNQSGDGGDGVTPNGA